MKRLLGAIAAAVALGGCADPVPPVTRIAANQWVGYAPVFAARDAGNLSASGVRIRAVEMSTATQVMTAMRAGMLEAAALTADEALRLIAEGADIRIAMVFNFSTGGDALLGRPGIGSVTELQGRRVGVEPTATGALMLAATLGRHGLRLGDVAIQPLEASAHLTAWKSGTLDAVVTYEPHITRLRAAGARVLADTSTDPELILDVLVVRADTDRAHGRAIRTLIDGYFRTLEAAASDPDGYAARVGPRLGLEPGDVRTSLGGIRQPGRDENLKLLSGNAPPARAMLERIADIMVAEGLLATRPRLDSAISAQWLPAEK